ncbi:hypothetical protein G7Z17_g3856 [Cylindrodendrum hubeiense]|uniref:Uncharacterized protein n=1 Tax=Cylindrodendrum hubeiense TaxID=595255 RepID=A0A9P5LIY1_9HYPO|nr:hypothetical protein G7Z17_g3856 [Cylindrodendrum hubeiense]
MPGRPRKWTQIEPREQHRHQQTQQDQQQDGQNAAQETQLSDQINSYQQDSDLQQSNHTPSIVFAEESSVATCSSTDLLPVVPQEWTSREGDDMVFSYDEFSALQLLDFNTSGQLDSLPLDSFRACLFNDVHDRDPTELSSNASVTSAAPQQSCDCAKQVFEVIRSLKRGLVCHSTIHTLRLGTDLFDKLLTCPICYDVSKPPRITLQNVLLLGRLGLEITTGYHKYLSWLKDYCSSLAEKKGGDTVYLIPGVDVSSALGFKISSDKFYDLITHGLQSDAERLSDLGRKFAVRQHNRHLIGHEACPDSEGRCWKEKGDIDPDPSDICPQSAAARALTPCYRIVDEVRSKIKQFEDSVT